MSKNYYIETYGCQMNVYDSELVASLLNQCGYNPTNDIKSADAIFLNTCAIREKAEETVHNKLDSLQSLKNNKPGSPLLLHDEPIYCDGKIVGRTTSGNYSFNYEKNISFGYLNLVSPIEELAKKTFFIEIEKKKYEAILQTKPLHDPENKIIKN